MPKNSPTPILFLDLDGTVRFNSDKPGDFIQHPGQVEIFPGVVELLKHYKSLGWRIVTISNQGGIAMGLLDPSVNNRIMAETGRLCANLFDRMLWCEHHQDAKAETEEERLEKASCFCRKPRTGLVMSAIFTMQQQFDEYYRPYSSLFVGDRGEDAGCAVAAGIPFMKAEDWRKQWTEEKGVIITLAGGLYQG